MAFTTETGQYQMKRLAMGMKISPGALSRPVESEELCQSVESEEL